MNETFIAHDWCGWNQQYGRFTHMHTGDTLICKASWGQSEWDQAQLEYFSKYPGINVYDCPGEYNRNGRLMGSTNEICERLEKRLFVKN